MMFKWFGDLYWSIDTLVSTIVRSVLNWLCLNENKHSYSSTEFIVNGINNYSDSGIIDCSSLIKNVQDNNAPNDKTNDIIDTSMPHDTLQNDTFYNPSYSFFECNIFNDSHLK